ncbi:hypothetical protein GPECTOR_59g636 [Gonium pectorale]|uniref:F-box domain-containing protein n=1 Tax=Gonium pectorale TaxID=33097 RepID=A0A150G5D3_GONPE|nr:hypothetical protein GPECTOR_59g636 [Gonium pectorale]|eukprot:KXZ45028.1 hypothetical protein GPECTOR_59g636 [Gonium pectorale]
MSAAQEHGSVCPSRVWSQLLPELAEKIVGYLDPNEVPSFRLVNKAAAAQFRAPHHTTYRLSQPVPPHAFAAHWLAPGATRGLTLKRRRQLLSLTAASGVVANLEVAVQAAGCLLTAGVFEAAAKAGQLDSCVWLREHGCPAIEAYADYSFLLSAAASGGHKHVCEWLLGLDLAWRWDGLLPELAEKIVGCLDPNEVPSFRLVNKAAAAQFRAPHHTTYRLSKPVPPHAFAAHWLAPGATRGLTLKRRRQLLSLTAASGVVANLEVAVQAAGCLLTAGVFEAAAKAGQLDSCVWLREHGCPAIEAYADYSFLLSAAASGGHKHVCEWLLGLDLAWRWDGVDDAARGGHVELMQWLLQRRAEMNGDANPSFNKGPVIACVAYGCDLPTLQRLWQAGGELDEWSKAEALTAATGSPTPDWAAKVEWLEAQGCPRRSANQAAQRPDAVARLAWLRARGFPLEPLAANAAAFAGNVAAVQYLLGEADVRLGEDEQKSIANFALSFGHLPVLQALHAAGLPVGASYPARAAACGGHLHVVAWLVETFGAEAMRMDAHLYQAAAASGNVQQLTWLRERGCEWDSCATTCAAKSGCEEAVEWLVAQGCPVEGNGDPYVNVCYNGDLAMARLLRRLGVPWGPAGRVVERTAECAPPPMLRWLLEEGCPVGDYEAARKAAAGRVSGGEEVLELLEAHRRQGQEGEAVWAA